MKKIQKTLLGITVGVSMLTIGSVQADAKFTVGGDSKFHWGDLAMFESMDFSGETVKVFGPWLGPDQEMAQSVFHYFSEATGANVDYVGSDDFETQIRIDVEGGSPPNIAVFPQPGLAADFAARGSLVPLGERTADWVRENYSAGQSWVDLGTFPNENGDDNLYGFFFKADLKSLVWYSPENFEDGGYSIPDSMEELIALSDQIVSDGGTPWCIGLGSGGATGWPATDWVEDIMLRTQSPSVYDQWVSNEIPFNDPRVVNAIETFGVFANNDSYNDGGAGSVASTDFRDSPKGLFTVPPRCYMHRQASFIPAFFPEDVKVGVDADFFYFPAFDSLDLGKPVLGAGTLWAVTKESSAASALMHFLKTPLANEIWMAQTGFLSAHNGANLDAYANDGLRNMGKVLQNATTFRFDGSDLMPGAVGAGSFWTGMVDYTSGKSAMDVANTIQKS